MPPPPERRETPRPPRLSTTARRTPPDEDIVVSRFAIVRRAGVAVLFVVAIVAGALLGVFLAYESELPQISKLEDYKPNIITQVFANDGKTLIGEFAIEKRVVVPFKDIPPVLRNAIIAVEDTEFWKHLGINPWRIPAAFIANLRAGRHSQGSSTLTMQLSRKLFLTDEKTWERKIKEAILAFQIEKSFTKEEIFTLYCNQVLFVHGNYGVEATSQFLFSKPIKDLQLHEAALIAGLPQNPSRLTPLWHPERATSRRNHVLRRMLDEKYISKAEYDRAVAQPLGLRVSKARRSVAPYFVEEVRKYLEREYGSQRIYQGGMRVDTTLDPVLQAAANDAVGAGLRALDRRARGFVKPTASVLDKDGAFPDVLYHDDWDDPIVVGRMVRGIVKAVDRNIAVVQIGDYKAEVRPQDVAWTRRTNMLDVLPRGAVAPFHILAVSEAGGEKRVRVALDQEPKVEGALIAIDTKTGAIKAMVGGYDFEKSKFNRAVQAYRQVGSAFKPIIYSAALEKLGWNPTTIIVDAPVSFPDPWRGTVWSPHNYDGRYLGAIPLRKAIEQSRNIPAIKTLQAVGVQTGIEYAKKLGISGELPPYLPMALGAGEVPLIEMTAAFAAFANQGLRMKPMMITRITDREGTINEETHPQASDAIRADTAYLLTHLLRGVVESPWGTAARARSLKRPIAGKTGTTNDFTDAWFIGYEPMLACGVWVGFDEKKDSLGKGETGGHAALPIWMDFWKVAIKDRPIEEYPIPGNIVFVPVDDGGRPGRPGTPGVHMVPFIAGTEPRAFLATTSASAEAPAAPPDEPTTN
jgi:penicillin-binding protein 1A